MMERRHILKGIAGLTAIGFVPRISVAAAAKVRVTLVRWPYT